MYIKIELRSSPIARMLTNITRTFVLKIVFSRHRVDLPFRGRKYSPAVEILHLRSVTSVRSLVE